ncbi:MAG: tetratricopeptide repeat protein, partial [Proteobacteria bacterium]
MAADSLTSGKTWLVKSSTKIMGPFTQQEVADLLSKRTITIIDEVRQPDSRWNYIRESRHFKEIVKNLRYEQDHSREDTMTSTMTSTATHGNSGATVTRTDSGLINDELTPAPIMPPMPPPIGNQRSTNAGVRDVTPSFPSQGNTKDSGSNVKSFGNLQDQRVQYKMQRQNLVLRTVTLTIVAMALLFVGYTFLRKDRKVDVSYDQLIASALRYKEIGLYQNSLENYKKAAAIREPDLETQFKLAFLLINEDRQSLNGRRIIERALVKEGRTPAELANGNLGIGLSYMLEGDFSLAEEFLQKVLGFEPNNEAAKINLAVLQMKKGNFAGAFDSFESLTKGDAKGYPLILMGKTLALIETSKAEINTERLQAGINEIKAYIAKSHFLYKELSMLLIYLNELAEQNSAEADAVATFMDEPHDLSKRYVKDLSLDWRSTEWDLLERYCTELADSGKSPE